VWTAAVRGIPAVVKYRGGDAAQFLARQMRIVRPTLERARRVVVPSGFLVDVFARHDIVTTVVPNIVNLERFGPATRLPRAPHYVVTRNLEAIYDIGTAIRALALVRNESPDASLTVAGEGPERDALVRLAGELGVAGAVHFIGRLDNSELPSLYRSASAMINPSRIDNMPISVLEAMASGVPVVSTNVGGIPYLVEHERTALLVPPGDASAMRAALLRLDRESGLAEALRTRGLESARQYAWSMVRPLLFDVYQQAREAASGSQS
jgi:glycosyltransferase involved in cell wall biosynthesis